MPKSEEQILKDLHNSFKKVKQSQKDSREKYYKSKKKNTVTPLR